MRASQRVRALGCGLGDQDAGFSAGCRPVARLDILRHLVAAISANLHSLVAGVQLLERAAGVAPDDAARAEDLVLFSYSMTKAALVMVGSELRLVSLLRASSGKGIPESLDPILSQHLHTHLMQFAVCAHLCPLRSLKHRSYQRRGSIGVYRQNPGTGYGVMAPVVT